jgi:hypothetical protein
LFANATCAATPRGVIELNDEDYSSVDEGDGVEEDAGLACEWPPRDPDAMKLESSSGGGGGGGGGASPSHLLTVCP